MAGHVKMNLDFKPATYWPPAPSIEERLSKIKGQTRRKLAKDILDQEGFAGLNDFLVREELPEVQKTQWGKIHPQFMGGEYLPNLEYGEIEIARISLKSTTGDQISIRAKQEDGSIRYSIVGEYEEDENMRYVLPFESSNEPLTLQALIELIDSTYIPGDIYPGGIVESNWNCAYDGEYDIETAMDFVSIESVFYPTLPDYYKQYSKKWISKRVTEQEAEEEAKRLETEAQRLEKTIYVENQCHLPLSERDPCLHMIARETGLRPGDRRLFCLLESWASSSSFQRDAPDFLKWILSGQEKSIIKRLLNHQSETGIEILRKIKESCESPLEVGGPGSGGAWGAAIRGARNKKREWLKKHVAPILGEL